MSSLLSFLGTSCLCAAAASAAVFVRNAEIEAPTVVTRADLTQTSVGATSSNQTAKLVPQPRPEIFYQAITDRPLFAQTRRPIELTQTAVEPNPEPEPTVQIEPVEEVLLSEPDATLLGVVAGGARNSALISIGGAEPEWQREGADIQGWTLETITTDAITLTERDRSLRIDLYRK